MSLHNFGLVPTVTPTELLPTRPQMREFWGTKTNGGFVFYNHDNPRYEAYVKELHTRVLQVNWPISGVISFHFARGLCAEAYGIEINWAEFAYKSTHPHQSHSSIPRVLPEFVEISEPLALLLKVLPLDLPEVSTSSPFPPLFLHCLLNSFDMALGIWFFLQRPFRLIVQMCLFIFRQWYCMHALPL